MKASQFEYVRAQHSEHALELLVNAGGEARLIAGGQSLVPMMAMRLATPGLLIDINRIDALREVNIDADAVWCGPTLTQAALESDANVLKKLPLVALAMPWVGHQQTRNRGTVGGSLTQADPSAELPLVAVVLDAQLEVSAHGTEPRWVGASQFYQGVLQTALQDTDMLQRIQWPRWAATNEARVGAGFDEIAIRRGDFAIASAACQLQIDPAGLVTRAALGLGGVDAVPLGLPNLAAQLVGHKPNAALVDEVANAAAKACDPTGDIHASAQYRRHLATVLLRRVIQSALNSAQGAD